MINANEAREASSKAMVNVEQEWLVKVMEQAEKLIQIAIKAGEFKTHMDLPNTGPGDNRRKLVIDGLVKDGYIVKPSNISHNQQPMVTRFSISWDVDPPAPPAPSAAPGTT